MRKRPRHDLSPRIELMPLIDVVFLLLTFFIYAIALMVQAEVLPFELAEVTGGQRAEATELQVLAIGPGGEYLWDGQVVTGDELNEKLEAIGSAGADASADPPSVLFITMAAEGVAAPEDGRLTPAVVDRGPVMFDLMQRLRRAGVERWSLVGMPERTAP